MGKDLFKTAAILIFSFFVVSCCHGQKHTNLNGYKVRKVDAKDAVVFIRISAESESGTIEASGTGVAVANQEDKTVILTAGHICESAVEPGVINANIMTFAVDGRGYYSDIIQISENFDLCLLSINDVLPIARIATRDPSSGDKVYYAGYPTGFYVPGLLHHFEGYMSGMDMVGDHMYNIPATGGSSGSPIYNERSEIVAILSAVMVDFHYMTFAVGTKNINDFMSDSGY